VSVSPPGAWTPEAYKQESHQVAGICGPAADLLRSNGMAGEVVDARASAILIWGHEPEEAPPSGRIILVTARLAGSNREEVNNGKEQSQG
jgi:hypothetical protein